MKYQVHILGEKPIDIDERTIDSLDVVSNADQQLYHVLFNGKSHRIHVLKIDVPQKTLCIEWNGLKWEIRLRDEIDLLAEKLSRSRHTMQSIAEVKAPMPGVILNCAVTPGDGVRKGDTLFVIEAMKMENIIRAPIDAVVDEVCVQAGDKVDKDAVLLRFHTQ